MHVLVIGKGGQVARSLVERGPGQGVTIATIGRPEIDFETPSTIEPAIIRHRADVIINAAAYTAVDQCEDNAERAFAINAAAPGRIARIAARLGVPLIHLSTDYVFDGSGEIWRTEDDRVAPLNVYGMTKLAGEEAVRRETSSHAILRTAWVFSPFGRNFVRTMLQLAETRDEIRVVADQIGSPTYAPDLADGLLAICRNITEAPVDADMFGTFHLTGSGTATWAEFASTIFAESARMGGPSARVIPIKSADYPTSARRPTNCRLSNDRVRELHKVILPAWQEGLTRCLAALRSNGGGYPS